jgi:hypothetical protein
MTHEMKNIMELNSFKNNLLTKADYGQDGFVIEGIVTYYAINKTVTEILNVYLIIGGYEPMIKLDIYSKGKIITSDKYHLDFNPKYDNIKFKYDNGQIIIEGKNSPKIGNYKVTIEERN